MTAPAIAGVSLMGMFIVTTTDMAKRSAHDNSQSRVAGAQLIQTNKHTTGTCS